MAGPSRRRGERRSYANVCAVEVEDEPEEATSSPPADAPSDADTNVGASTVTDSISPVTRTNGVIASTRSNEQEQLEHRPVSPDLDPPPSASASSPSSSDSSPNRDDAQTVIKGRDQDPIVDFYAGKTDKDIYVALDEGAEYAQQANAEYKQEILSLMDRLAKAADRTDELEGMVHDMAEVMGQEPDLRLMAPGMSTVTLPWFTHFHGQDLPSNPDGEARDEYLRSIRVLPWSTLERSSLKNEVLRANKTILWQQLQAQGLSTDRISQEVAIRPPHSFLGSTQGLNWQNISLAIHSQRRSAAECRIQWTQVDHPLIKRGAWSKAELQKLYVVVDKKKERDWAGIAAEVGNGRTVADCLKHYRLRPLPKENWSSADDDRLREAVGKWGENWQSVARHTGRHSNSCINRWNKSVRPDIRRGKWSKEEDENLIAAVQACHTGWFDIALRMDGRTDAQCRDRWSNILDPNIARGQEWTPEEDEVVLRLRGEGTKWFEISAALDGRRTDNHCMRRYTELVGKTVAKKRQAESGLKAPARKRGRPRKPPPDPNAPPPTRPKAKPQPKPRVLTESEAEAEDAAARAAAGQITAASVGENGAQAEEEEEGGARKSGRRRKPSTRVQ